MLGISVCYGSPPGAPDHIAHNLLRPAPNDALGPNIIPAAPPDGESSIVGRYQGSSNCFPIDLQSQLITDP